MAKKLGQTAFGCLGHIDLEKLYEMKKKKRLKRTTESKVMAFRRFQTSMRILCLSNHLGCSFSLYLLVDLAKTYENKWSQCSNDQIIKNLWLPEVRNLLMQCYATQYCNETFNLLQYGLKLPWPSFYNVTH